MPHNIPAPLHRLLRLASILTVIAILAYLGSLLLQEKIQIAKPLQFIGHADEAAYVAMGESLSEGHGLFVRYISWHFIPYSQDITRREDHWPPFMGFAIAPCFLAFGKLPWVAKIPAIFFGSIGLPLATAALAYALCRRGYAAIIAGLLMLTSALLYTESLKTLSDIANAMLVTAFCAALIGAARKPWLHLLAGFFAAAAFYAKGSELLLLPLYPLMALLIEGPSTLARRWLYLGLLTASLLIAPWLYDNYSRYHNPLHSTQNFVSGYMGFEDWEPATYTPYWGGANKPLPNISDRWTKHADEFASAAAQNRELIARYSATLTWSKHYLWADLGSYGFRARDFLLASYSPTTRNSRRATAQHERELAAAPLPIKDWTNPPLELASISAIAFAAIALPLWPIAFLTSFYKSRRRKKRLLEQSSSPTASSPNPHPLNPPPHRGVLYSYVGPPLALALLVIAHAAFLSYLWEIQPRFIFLFPPILAATGCAFAALVLELPLRLLGQTILAIWKKSSPSSRLLPYARLLRHWHLALTLFLALWLYTHSSEILSRKTPASSFPQLDSLQASFFSLPSTAERSGYPYSDQLTQVTAGTWIGKNLPDAVIMTRFPWQLLFYASPRNKAVAVPYASADEIFSIARYYRCTHLLFDTQRDALYPYLDNHPGLKAVPNFPGKLYEIDYTHLPTKPMHELYKNSPQEPRP